MAPEQALQQLLAGTRLTVKRDGERALVIVPAEADAPQAPTVVLKKVLVSAAAMHLADINRTGTRTDADPMTLPQSISTISS